MTSYTQGAQATLTAQWYAYSGGPAADVTGITVTITRVADSTVVIGPTSSGITHPATGLYAYVWWIPADETTGDYAVVWDATDQSSNPVQASEVVTVTAASGILYATLDELKGRVGRSDSVRDDLLADALLAASRDVDEDTGRRFYLDGTASARTYNPRGRTRSTGDGDLLFVDDIGDTTGLIVEIGASGSWTTVASGDYEAYPDNALARGWAITGLLWVANVWAATPYSRVRVTAKWGWPAVPAPIKNATLIRAQRLYRRKDSPEGVAGFSDLGVMRVGRFDPDYDAQIGPYMLPGFGGY